MKTSHHCPKCDSTKIAVYKGSRYNQYSIGATSKWGTGTVVLDRYFCANCGYSEEYAQINDRFLKWAEGMIEKQGGPGDGFV